MLTVEGIRAHLERLSYKDGWSFDVYEGRWEGPHIFHADALRSSWGLLLVAPGLRKRWRASWGGPEA
jgi:hypothetical protein